MRSGDLAAARQRSAQLEAALKSTRERDLEKLQRELAQAGAAQAEAESMRIQVRV